MSTPAVRLEMGIRTESSVHHNGVAVDSVAVRTWPSSHLRTAYRVAGVLALITVLVVAAAIILPETLPNLIHTMTRSPLTPLLVVICWVAATVAAITGKRILTGGCLTWPCTATAHISGTVANRVVPAGAGAAGAFLMAMRRGGLPTTAAAGVIAMWAVAGGLVHGVGLLLGVVWLKGGEIGLATVVLLAGTTAAAAPTAIKRARVRIHSTPARWHALLRPDDWNPRSRFGRAMRKRAQEVKTIAGDALATVRARPVIAIAALVAQLVAMLCLAVGFAAAAVSMGVSVPVAAAVAAYVAGIAASATAPTPAGIGAAEAALVGTLMVAGATITEALPPVLLFRAVVLLIPVAVAALIFAVWSIKRGRSSLTAAVGRRRSHSGYLATPTTALRPRQSVRWHV